MEEEPQLLEQQEQNQLSEGEEPKEEQPKECILRGKSLKSVPAEAWQDRDIYKLSLQGNKLKDLPPQLRRLKNLQELILSFNAFDKFPLVACDFQNLRTLSVSRNRLKTVSSQICQLTNLQDLWLTGNVFEEFPEALCSVELGNLEKLYLYDNKIANIPQGIARLKKLKVLNINNNKVREIPEAFYELKNLENFHAKGNKIKKLPPKFGTELNQIKLLELNGNPLVIPSLAVCQRGINAIKDFQDKKKAEAESTRAALLARQQVDGVAQFRMNNNDEKITINGIPKLVANKEDVYCIDGIPAYRVGSLPRGLAVIINNHHFKTDPSCIDESRQLPDREGTQIDKEKLQSIFSQLKFEVQVHEDLSSDDLMRVLIQVSQEDHEVYDMFVCCILTHGSAGVVYGSDSIAVKISDITSTFVSSRCPTLRGKPKLFFIQACQNEESEKPEGLQEDAVHVNNVIPDQADFLLGYATVPGFVSYRHTTDGSWYVGALVKALDKYYNRLHLLDILTIVNDTVAQESSDGFVQVPAPQYTLRKRLYLDAPM